MTTDTTHSKPLCEACHEELGNCLPSCSDRQNEEEVLRAAASLEANAKALVRPRGARNDTKTGHEGPILWQDEEGDTWTLLARCDSAGDGQPHPANQYDVIRSLEANPQLRAAVLEGLGCGGYGRPALLALAHQWENSVREYARDEQDFEKNPVVECAKELRVALSPGKSLPPSAFCDSTVCSAPARYHRCSHCEGVVTEKLRLAESRLTEYEQRLARIAELAHDRNDDSHEKRSVRLGQCASLAWDHMEESFSKDPLNKQATLKWAHLAEQATKLESELAEARAANADLRNDLLDIAEGRNVRPRTEAGQKARARAVAVRAKDSAEAIALREVTGDLERIRDHVANALTLARRTDHTAGGGETPAEQAKDSAPSLPVSAGFSDGGGDSCWHCPKCGASDLDEFFSAAAGGGDSPATVADGCRCGHTQDAHTAMGGRCHVVGCWCNIFDRKSGATSELREAPGDSPDEPKERVTHEDARNELALMRGAYSKPGIVLAYIDQQEAAEAERDDLKRQLEEAKAQVSDLERCRQAEYDERVSLAKAHATLYDQLEAAKAERATYERAIAQFDTWLGEQAEFFKLNPQVNRTFLDVAAKIMHTLRTVRSEDGPTAGGGDSPAEPKEPYTADYWHTRFRRCLDMLTERQETATKLEAQLEAAHASYDQLRSERDHYVHEASRLAREFEAAQVERASSFQDRLLANGAEMIAVSREGLKLYGRIAGALDRLAPERPIPSDGEPVVEEPACWCYKCSPSLAFPTRMIVCPTCGNKRCPKAEWHDYQCTGSNESGQVGVEEYEPAVATCSFCAGTWTVGENNDGFILLKGRDGAHICSNCSLIAAMAAREHRDGESPLLTRADISAIVDSRVAELARAAAISGTGDSPLGALAEAAEAGKP